MHLSILRNENVKGCTDAHIHNRKKKLPVYKCVLFFSEGCLHGINYIWAAGEAYKGGGRAVIGWDQLSNKILARIVGNKTLLE